MIAAGGRLRCGLWFVTIRGGFVGYGLTLDGAVRAAEMEAGHVIR